MTRRRTKTAKTAKIVEDDPGTLICVHEHRIHYLGGEIWVCFACWARLLVGPGRRS